MKKCRVTLLFVLAAIILAFIFIPERVEIPKGSSAKIINTSGGNDIVADLSEDESRTIAKIFDGRAYMVFEIPACFFSDFRSIWFGDDFSLGFCPAFDGCDIIYDMEADAYFRISYLGAKKLHNILENYGFEFP